MRAHRSRDLRNSRSRCGGGSRAGELGLTAVGGGRHDGLGTHNRIVPFGDGSFLELLAVADPQEARDSAIGSAVAAAIARGDGLIGWAVAVEDLTAVAARLGAQISAVGREGMAASLTGVEESLAEPFLPFFIERSPTQPVADRPGAPRAISWIEVAGDALRLERWLGGAELPVRVFDGEPGLRAIGLGERELRTG